MHGELTKARCAACAAVHASADALSVEDRCPACGAAHVLRPDVVWFGEIPMFMDVIAAAIADAELFVAIGTSGSVYPAAGLVSEARGLGVPCVELNLEPSENAFVFSERRYGRARDIVPPFVEDLISGRSAP